MIVQNRFKLKSLLLLCFASIYYTSTAQSTDTACEDFSVTIPILPHNWVSAPCLEDGTFEVWVNNGMAPYTYLWSNGDTTEVADSLANGELYSVTVTDANNCVATEENIRMGSAPAPPQPYMMTKINGPEVTFTAVGQPELLDLIVSYQWSIEGAPGVQSFTHLFTEPGTYYVSMTLTDVCGQKYSYSRPIDVWVSPAEAFTFDIGAAEGQAGDTIALPVSVKKFNKISGFQKSIHLLDDQTGKIVGFHDFNLEGLSTQSFERKSDDLWSMVWFQQDPVTLPDDSIIYYIDVLLTNSEEACTKITFDNSDIPLQIATIDENNQPVSIQSPWIRASETCVKTTASLGGQITTPDGRPIENVRIINSGTDDLLTDENGVYLILNLVRNQSYAISPEKLDADINDLTTLDLILILKHILNREVLDSPYKLVAADVNNDRTITVLDLITLQQFILNKIPELPAGNWIFLPKQFQFTNNENILSNSFPTEITTSELITDQLDYDFIGIRVGDVSYDIEELR